MAGTAEGCRNKKNNHTGCFVSVILFKGSYRETEGRKKGRRGLVLGGTCLFTMRGHRSYPCVWMEIMPTEEDRLWPLIGAEMSPQRKLESIVFQQEHLFLTLRGCKKCSAGGWGVLELFSAE